MEKMTRKVALLMAIDSVDSAEAKEVLTKMVEQLDAKSAKAGQYADKTKAKESADRAELGHILANAITDEAQTLSELIKSAGLEISTQKAVRCLGEIGIKGERVKGKVVYVATSATEGE